MLKIFLVEDEFIVREGIKKNIDWKANGYDFCGEASDGEMAMPMIRELKPDIVITDIKMPFMDGLVLSRLIKEEYPNTEIIILTGHEKFEYAKEAIRLGIAEYLSKPISSSEILNEVNLLAQKIYERQRESEIRERYIHEIEEYTRNERNDLFRNLVNGKKSISEIRETAGKLKINIDAGWYNILLFQVNSLLKDRGEYSDSVIEIEEGLKNIDKESNILVFERDTEGMAILFMADTRNELLNRQQKYINEAEKLINGYGSIHYFGGIGIPVDSIDRLRTAFEDASRAFSHRYFIDDSSIVDGADLHNGVYLKKDEFDIAIDNTQYTDRGKVKEFLKTGRSDEVIYFIEELFGKVSMKAMESVLFRQYIAMDVYFCVMEFIQELQLPGGELESYKTTQLVVESVEAVIRYIIEIVTKATELREKVASNRYDDVVCEVMKYIDTNYANDELSLNSVASHVNFSPNHLSMIFSQQTGHTFIKYLTDFRMNKAKELLRCSGKKSNIIAMEVGYKDPHYFSFLFKKTQNMTPTQYRCGKTCEVEE